MMTTVRMLDKDGGTVEYTKDRETMREFDTGATRDTAVGKLDYEGFLSPLVLEAYATYMKFNLDTPKGLRDSDNWQKGIPRDVYIKSAWRHFIDWWSIHRDVGTKDTIVWACCAVLFNVMGYLHESLREDPDLLDDAVRDATLDRDRKRGCKDMTPDMIPDPWMPVPAKILDDGSGGTAQSVTMSELKKVSHTCGGVSQ